MSKSSDESRELMIDTGSSTSSKEKTDSIRRIQQWLLDELGSDRKWDPNAVAQTLADKNSVKIQIKQWHSFSTSRMWTQKSANKLLVLVKK